MSSIKWEDVDGVAGCSVGVVGPYKINAFGNGYWGNWQIRRSEDTRVIASATLPESRENPPTLAAVKLHADATLLDLHNAFAVSFAPVLRWQRDMHSVGAIDGNSAWVLEADSEGWSLWVREGAADRVMMLSGYKCTTREANRCAAEAALRGLGVSFRAEDGQ